MLLERISGIIQRIFLQFKLKLLAFLVIALLSERRLTTSSVQLLTTSTSSTRSKGKVICYSCFSKNFGVNYDSKAMSRKQLDEPYELDNSNLTDMMFALKEEGMRIPAVAERCSDTLPIVNPNFDGIKLKACTNTEDQPGACVKFKGYYKGEPFIYRECWSRMWMNPRPYQHKMSGNCYNDEMVQNFVGNQTNTICFCEDDLCNLSNKLSQLTLFTTIFLFVCVFHLHLFT